MSLIVAHDVSLQLGTKWVLDGDTATVEKGDRLGIVGPNGAGKSTLLKVLAGFVEPESGTVNRQRGMHIGYLAQELPTTGDRPLLASLVESAPRKAEIEDRIAAIEDELSRDGEPDRHAELGSRLGDLHVELADLERRFAPHIAARILVGLGFREAQFSAPLSTFSGGWRMRAELARLLFQQPEVLLLDEPTNHLDMPSVAWLDRFLDSFQSALVLICHDRRFLNRHVERVLSFEVEGLRSYAGDYDEYKRLRGLELENLENRARKDEARRRDLEAFVTRFKAKASKARQAQSKQKLIEKMEAEAVDIPKPRRTIALEFRDPPRGSDPAIEIEGLGHAYGEKRIFAPFDATIREGDRVAIVGLNGAGKTTLLKLIAGELAIREGRVRFGVHTQPRHYAQHHSEALTPSRTVLEEVGQVAPELGQSRLRAVLGAFLFGEDEIEKRIAVLSGGEKARVALAKLLVKPGNLLLLDEPTNHLDTESAQRLTESLLRYKGTILFVSHDLDFARTLATRVLDLRDGKVIPYPGSLADYLDKLAGEQRDAAARFGGDELAASKPGKGQRSPGRGSDDKDSRVKARDERKQLDRQRQKLERRLVEIEATIATLEGEKSALDLQLSDPALWQDGGKAKLSSERHAVVERQLAAALGEWTEISSKLAALPAAD
jgi:ATP-binding cassette subfamily F protein 3